MDYIDNNDGTITRSDGITFRKSPDDVLFSKYVLEKQQAIVITNYQMHMSLAKRGLYDAVINVIETLPETLHHEALVLFHKAPVAHSDNVLVMQILEAIGLDADEQRELFEFALTL